MRIDERMGDLGASDVRVCVDKRVMMNGWLDDGW